VALTSIAKAVYDKSIKKIDDDAAADSAAVVTVGHFDDADELEDLQVRALFCDLCVCCCTSDDDSVCDLRQSGDGNQESFDIVRIAELTCCNGGPSAAGALCTYPFVFIPCKTCLCSHNILLTS
jgi:hypothetical protein